MSADDDIRNLSKIPILGALEIDALRLIVFAGETRILRASDVLFRRGDRSDCGYVLTSGVIAFDERDDGSAATLISKPFTLIGELALISETERPVTAVARQPTTVLKIPRTLFLRVLREYPASARILRAMMSARVDGIMRELNEKALSWEIEPLPR